MLFIGFLINRNSACTTVQLIQNLQFSLILLVVRFNFSLCLVQYTFALIGRRPLSGTLVRFHFVLVGVEGFPCDKLLQPLVPGIGFFGQPEIYYTISVSQNIAKSAERVVTFAQVYKI